jgi:hypothetical protein
MTTAQATFGVCMGTAAGSSVDRAGPVIVQARELEAITALQGETQK